MQRRQLLTILLSGLSLPVIGMPNKYALIIANSNYSKIPLPGVKKDSVEVSESLASIGFNTQIIENVSSVQIEKEMKQIKRYSPHMVVIYYAGHGAKSSLNETLWIGINNQPISTNRVSEILQGIPMIGLISDSCRTEMTSNTVSPSSFIKYKSIIWELFSTSDIANDLQYVSFAYLFSQYIKIPNLDIKRLSEKLKEDLQGSQMPQWTIYYPNLEDYDKLISLN